MDGWACRTTRAPTPQQAQKEGWWWASSPQVHALKPCRPQQAKQEWAQQWAQAPQRAEESSSGACGALGEPGALGDSNGRGLLCPRCAQRGNSCLGRCGHGAGHRHSTSCACGAFLPMTQHVCHHRPEPPVLLNIAIDVAVRHVAWLCSRLCCIVLAIFCAM